MAQKVFISYKYADDNVQVLSPYDIWHSVTVRDYVTAFQTIATRDKIIVNKGENDNEDLSRLSETTIWNKLRDRIYDSTVTVVFISPNMRVPYKEEKYQWIPREISFSLREQSRSDRTSNPNALLFVVLPNRYGDYTYYRTMNHFSIVAANINNGYGEVVEWGQFIQNIPYYLERANARSKSTPSYKIVKTIT